MGSGLPKKTKKKRRKKVIPLCPSNRAAVRTGSPFYLGSETEIGPFCRSELPVGGNRYVNLNAGLSGEDRSRAGETFLLLFGVLVLVVYVKREEKKGMTIFKHDPQRAVYV